MCTQTSTPPDNPRQRFEHGPNTDRSAPPGPDPDQRIAKPS